MASLRVDLVFSYWIFLWYILYYFKYVIYSPKFVILLGLIENVCMFIFMLIYGTSKKTMIFFVIINVFIKVIPYYLLRNDKITMKDIYATCVVFMIFIIWLYINNQSLTGNAKLIYDSLIHGKNKTPFMSILAKFEKNYKNLEVI